MKRAWMGILLLGVGLSVTSASADDTLAHWAETFDTPQTQQAILKLVFSGQVGPLSAGVLDKTTGSYLFPKSDNWVRVGQKVYVPAKAGGPYLVVSCMFYNKPEQGPITAASYIFFDTSSRPDAITGGYAAQESIDDVTLPKIGRHFLVVVSQSTYGGSKQISAQVLFIRQGGHPRTVWTNPLSARSFQFGFNPLGGGSETLIFKTFKSGQVQYSGYRWNGDRFELDGFASETQMKALPADAWAYGSGS